MPPCVAHVIGLDVRNGSGEHFVCGLRDWARCQVRLFQRTVRSLRDWLRMKNILVQGNRQADVAKAWTEAYRTSVLTEFYCSWPLGFQGQTEAPHGNG